MILITGATGHIGNVLTRTLFAQGHEDLRVFALPGEDISRIGEYICEVARGDIRDEKAVAGAVAGCAHVFHLAGLVTVSPSDDKKAFAINYGGTQNVIAACQKHNARLVYVSTTDALKHPKQGKIDETMEKDIKKLRGAYAQSKAMAMQAVMAAAVQGLSANIVCPSAVIGPYDYGTSLTGKVVIGYVRADKTQFYFDGKYDFVDVRDAVDGMIRVWKNARSGEVFCLSGYACSLIEMMNAVESSTGRAIRRIRLPAFVVSAAAVVASAVSVLTKIKPPLSKSAIDVLLAGTEVSSQKAKDVLGYCPRPLRDTVDDMVAWYGDRKK